VEAVFQISEDILIACVKGEIDHHNAAPLRNSIDESMKAFGCSRLILDFSGVEMMDSSGIGVVLGRYKKLRKNGGTLCISGCSEHIERVLDMAGVFSLIRMADDIENAICILQGQEQMRMEV